MRTELHRHLDASFRPSTLFELALKYGVRAPFASVEEIPTRFWLTRQMASLQEVLDCFVLFQQVLRTTDDLERVAREAVEDARAEGIDQLELRYSPSFTSELSAIPWDDALDAFLRGVRDASLRTGVRTGLLCIVSRGYPEPVMERTMDFAVSRRSDFIGVDLAGAEEGFPCRLFKRIFRMAADAGLPATVHAGEACGPKNVWEAIDDLGARRIGHGIRSVEDPVLVTRLARDGILLETCPTSNYVTRSVATWADHPLPRLLHAGVPVSVSTDDPGIFGVTLGEEYARCRTRMGLDDGDLARIDAHAAQHTFLR